LESIQDKVRWAVDDGAEVLLHGEPFGPTGLCLPPRILTGTNDVATARRGVRAGDHRHSVDGDDDALRLANDTQYGLSSAVFSREVDRAVRFARRVQALVTHVNDSSVNYDANTAFGGEKESGIGRFGAQWAVQEFTTDHWLAVGRS
jgi:aldehyde dehydrogenase (NAD+)